MIKLLTTEEESMRLQKERKEIVKFGKKLLTSALTAGTGGNLSVANRKKNRVAISPERRGLP